MLTSMVSSLVQPQTDGHEVSGLMAVPAQAQRHITSHFRIVSCFGCVPHCIVTETM